MSMNSTPAPSTPSNNTPAPSAPSNNTPAPSAPAATATANIASNTATNNTTSNNTPANLTPPNPSNPPPPGAVGPHNIRITERILSNAGWPSDLILDVREANWAEWSRRATLLALRQGFTPWLDGSLRCPDESTYPDAHWVWNHNDGSLRGFLLEHISPSDYNVVSRLKTSHEIWNGLRKRHENLGPYAQVLLIKKALEVKCDFNVPLSKTITELRTLHHRIITMGKLEDDYLLTVLLLNALGDQFAYLQSSIQSMSTSAGFSSESVIRRMEDEEALIQRRVEQGLQPSAVNPSAFAAMTARKPRLPCSNCKRTNHSTDFCIAPGGKMAGRSLEDAISAQRAASAKAPRAPRTQQTTQVANIATLASPTPSPSPSPTPTPPPPSPTPSLMINGIQYFPAVPSASICDPSLPAQSANTAFHSPVHTISEPYEYHAFLAVTNPPQTSIDWSAYSQPVNQQDNTSAPTAFTASQQPALNLADKPFILDSGATSHISPVRSDFKTFCPIPPLPVNGMEGSSVYATGVGTIDLHTACGHKLSLTNVLYIPASCVRLISVLSLNKTANCTSHFDSNTCWITDQNNSVIARGTVSLSRNLFIIPHLSPLPPPSHSPSAFLANRTPNVETWHRRLGHCSTRTVIDMAKSSVVQGMPIDLSTSPPMCNPCVLGKQTRSSVPRVREGVRATRPFERVHLDLCGPMSIPSRSGRLYSMNVIDDFSSYVWSLPLKNKNEAASVFQWWHKAIQNLSNRHLSTLVTDNGELVSKAMSDYCLVNGITHLRTAPYTSAHNGRAERLHRTLLDKARTMRLACSAPPNMWDEFCATAAYLTNLTASSSLNGKTPFELWHGRTPSLSHLREIGCLAYALIPTHNPKILQRSTPCKMIGYAPLSKAYRLWDTSTNKIFNSFHVTFFEHLDTIETPLLPNTTLGTTHALSPPTWDSPAFSVTPPPPPSPHSLHPPIPPTLPYPSTAVFPLDSPHPSETNTVTATASPHITSPQITTTNTVDNTNNTTTTQNDDAHIHLDTSCSNRNDSTPSPNTHRPSNNNSDTPDIPTSCHTTPTVPPPDTLPLPKPTLRRSLRLAELNQHRAQALLCEFASVRDTHDLLPVIPCPSISAYSMQSLLLALEDGSVSPDLDSDDDPSWNKALASPEREYWIAGAREEITSLENLNVFVLVPRSEVPPGQKPLKGKLVCRRKRDDSGNVVRYKVRYVAKGFAQKYGIDYDKTTAPTARLESLRCLLHVAASLDWDIQQFDVKTAFLHGVLPESETMFMEQPPGFAAPDKQDWVMRLMKSIYGMKQASRIWNQTFHKSVTEWGFERLPCEWCVYRRQTPTGTIIFAVHVDDIISAASSVDENERFKASLKAKWDISDLGAVKYALGIAMSRDRDNRTISLSQTALIDRIVLDFNQHDSHPVDTPMVPGNRLLPPDPADPMPPSLSTWIEKTPYRSLIGSLNYLAVGTRPDISFTVGRLASFLDCYRPEHWEAAIRVVRYLKGTRLLTLQLGGTTPVKLIGYSDSDYANCPVSSKSIGGYCYSLGSGAVSWSSRKQKTVADSSCYAEYIALHDASHEAVFLRQLLSGVNLLPPSPTPLFCDNDAASQLTEDHIWHSRVKHIRVKYHYTRELVADGQLIVQRVRSHDNIADIMTKALARTDFTRLRHYLGLRAPPSNHVLG